MKIYEVSFGMAYSAPDRSKLYRSKDYAIEILKLYIKWHNYCIDERVAKISVETLCGFTLTYLKEEGRDLDEYVQNERNDKLEQKIDLSDPTGNDHFVIDYASEGSTHYGYVKERNVR
jgi:hypothetical protein